MTVPSVSLARTNAWSPRGFFSFLELLLDFERAEERGPFGDAALLDCSDQTVYCASGAFTHLVLPRRCSDVGQLAWNGFSSPLNAHLRTEVIWRGEEPLSPHGTRGRQVWLLADAQQPYVVFDYRANEGIVGVYYDRLSRNSVISMARGGIERLRAALLSSQIRYSPLISRDHMGACA